MKLYRALLHLYPASFRAEYGAEMCAVFARDLKENGMAAWARALADTLVNATRVHLDITYQDLRYAFRSLARTPGFTITAIVVAALGIGATTATFTVADHILLKPLPFADPERLVKIWENQASRGYPQLEPSPPNFKDWKRLATSFADMEAYTGDTVSLVGVGDPERLLGARTTGGVFRMLGRGARLGRVLEESDITSTQNPIVLSDSLWRTRFGADPEVIGHTLSLDEATHMIVGVMPPDFTFPSAETTFWRPLRFDEQNGDEDRTNFYLQVVGRLKNGVAFQDARAELQVIGMQLERQYPKENAETGITALPWRDNVGSQSRLLLTALIGASLCVLLIACTNLANLLLSRALSRRGEFAVRAAVGASLDRLVRQMLTDSLVLSIAGGALGILIAIAAGPLIAKMLPATVLPITGAPDPDLRMLLVAAIVTIATGLAFGVVPALRVCRNTDASALKEGARGGTGKSTERLRSILVVAEITASVVLLVAAGLLVQALLRVQTVDPGFKADNVLTMRTMLPRPKYNPTERRLQFYQQVTSDLRALPGVTSVSYISFLPMTMRGGIWSILTTVPDPQSPQRFVAADPANQKSASLRFVTPGFFETVGTPILQGRDVRENDSPKSQFVAVVSRSFAKQHFPNQDPIGQQFAIAFFVRTIVGVVGDIRVRGLERESEPQVYLPAAQQPNGMLAFYAPQDLVIRATVPASTLIPAARAIIWKADPQQPITSVKLLSDVVAGETAPRVTQLRVIGAFAAVALVLAAIGIHGLLAFSVSARVREIGVRMALGASAGDILRIVVGRSAMLGGVGVALGAALAYAVGRSMQALLAGVDPADASVFAAAVGISILMTVAGSLVPAMRAVRVDPLTATRAE